MSQSAIDASNCVICTIFSQISHSSASTEDINAFECNGFIFADHLVCAMLLASPLLSMLRKTCKNNVKTADYACMKLQTLASLKIESGFDYCLSVKTTRS